MAHNADGLITSPVRMKEDVRYVLFGDTSSDFKLSVLNTTSNINKWSKVKPMGNATWGLNVTRQTMASGLKAMYENADNWAFVAPDNSVQWPYKLVAHFTDYLHTARIIATVNVSPSQYYIEDTDMVFVQALFNEQTYALNILDFLDIVKPQADHLYFGVVIHGPGDTWTLVRNPQAIGVDIIPSADGSGKWQRNLYLTGAELPTLSGYQSTIYPVVTAEYNGDTRKSSTDIAINGNGITLPVSPVTVTSITIASYLHGSLSGITITKAVNAYYATFTYSVQNQASRSYNFPAQTATFYLCSRVQDPSGYQGWQILGTFSASISSFNVGANSTVSRTITQLWSTASDPLVVAAADTSISLLKVYLAMPGDIANAGFYDVEATASLYSIDITTYDDPISIHDSAVQWGITAHWSDGDEYPSSGDVTWSSSDTSKATVDANGYVTGVSAGQVTITAQYMGKTATKTVYVRSVVTGVSLSMHNMQLEEGGDPQSLTATISPNDATIQYVRWNVSNSHVKIYTTSACTTEVPTGTDTSYLTVYVKGISEGSASVGVTTTDGSYTDSCAVTVVTPAPPSIPVEDVTILDSQYDVPSSHRIELPYTTTYYQLHSQVYPNNATNVTYTWDIVYGSASVNSTGYVSDITPGQTIRVNLTVNGDQSSRASDYVDLVIGAKPVTGISISESSMTLYKPTGSGHTGTVYATVSPSDATNRYVNWRSSDTSVATVSAVQTYSGVSITVTAVGGGTCQIIAEADGNSSYTASCAVTVIVPVTGVSLNKGNMQLETGSSDQLTAYVAPRDATNQSVYWNSSNSNIATVDSYGNVTAVAAGTCDITVTTWEGSYTATCHVTVSDPQPVTLQSIYISGYAGAIFVGGEMTLKIMAVWSSGSDTDVTYANGWDLSGCSSILQLETGTVGTFKGIGSGGSGTLAASYMGKSASIPVTVTAPYMEVWRHNTSTGAEYVITSYTYTKLNTYINLFAKVYNKDYPNGSTSGFSWSLPSGQNVVSMSDYSSYKRFTATNNGSTTLTVSHSSGLSENITLTVDDPSAPIAITGAYISDGYRRISTLNMGLGESVTLYAEYEPSNATLASSPYAWSKVGSSSYITVSGNGDTATVTSGNITGSQSVRLRITDSAGNHQDVLLVVNVRYQ